MTRYRGLTVRGVYTQDPATHMAAHAPVYSSPTKPGQAIIGCEIEWEALQPTGPGSLASAAVQTMDDWITEAAVPYNCQLMIRVAVGVHVPGGLVKSKVAGTTVSTTVAAASNGASVTSATWNVANTADFWTTGQFTVTVNGTLRTIAYTGKTGTTLTGCSVVSGGTTGTLSTGLTVTSTAKKLPSADSNFTAGSYTKGWLEATTTGHWTAGAPNPHPVAFINTYSTDPNVGASGFPHHFPYHADAGLAYWHNELLVLLAAWQAGDCPVHGSAHPRSEHIHSWPLARPAEIGTEMTINYGANGTTTGYTNLVEMNTASWNVFGTEAARRTAIKNAWFAAADDFAAASADWYAPIAGGQVFGDAVNTGVAFQLRQHIDAMAAGDKARFMFMTTNLNGAWSTGSAAVANWLKACADQGYRYGLQFSTTGDSSLANMQSSIADARAKFGDFDLLEFVEPNPARVPNNSDGRYEYLLSIQSEIQRAPTVPTSPSATADGQTLINLAWTNGTDADNDLLGVEVWRRTGAAAFAKIGQVVATAIGTAPPTSYADSTVAAGTLYDYQLRSFDLAAPPHYSSFTSTVSATTDSAGGPDTTPPDPPATASATQNGFTPTVNLEWLAGVDPDPNASGVVAHKVYQEQLTPVAAGPTLLATVDMPSLGLVATGLTFGATYRWQVFSVDDADLVSLTGTYTQTVTVTEQVFPTPAGIKRVLATILDRTTLAAKVSETN